MPVCKVVEVLQHFFVRIRRQEVHQSRNRIKVLQQRILISITLALFGPLGLCGLTLAHAGLWAYVG